MRIRSVAESLTYFYFFGLSLFVFPGLGDSVRGPQWLWASLGGALVALFHFGFFGKKEWRSLRRILPWGAWAWLAFILMRAFLGDNPFRAFVVLVAPGMVLFAAVAVFQSPVRLRREKVFLVLFLVTLLQAIFGFLQMLGLDPLFTRKEVPGLPDFLPGGFLGQHTFFGLLMAWLAFVWLIERKWAFSILCAAMVCLTGSAFSLASLVFGILFFLYGLGFRRSTALLGIFSISGGTYFFVMSDPSSFFFDNGRFEIWVLSVSAILQKPLLGYGIAAFSEEFPRYQQGSYGMRWEEAHNEWIEYVFNTGVVGAVFLLLPIWCLGSVIYRLPPSKDKNLATGTLLMLGINSLGNFPLQLAPFAALAIVAVVFLFQGSVAGSDRG